MLLARDVYFYFALRYLWGNHVKHEKCNKTIKQTIVASVARRPTGGGGAARTELYAAVPCNTDSMVVLRPVERSNTAIQSFSPTRIPS